MYSIDQFKALAVPTILHGIYDFILMYREAITETDTSIAAILSIGFFVFFFIVWKTAIRRVKKMVGK